MFEFEAGGSNKSRMSTSAERKSAQRKWPFLTPLDLSMIHNQTQLAVMVRDRTGRAQRAADLEVRAWLAAEAIGADRRPPTKVTRLADYRWGVAKYYPGATMR